MLAAPCEDGDSDVVSLCRKYGITRSSIRSLVDRYEGGKDSDENRKTLEKYGQDLTASNTPARAPLIRSSAVTMRSAVPLRSCLVGKEQPCSHWGTGVGKTAIVEGLARRIVAGDVPESLKNKTLYALTLRPLSLGPSTAANLKSA